MVGLFCVEIVFVHCLEYVFYSLPLSAYEEI